MSTAALLAIGMPGIPELLIILFVVLVLFGKKIPGVARSMGSGITEFKKGLREGEQGARQLDEEVKRDSADEAP